MDIRVAVVTIARAGGIDPGCLAAALQHSVHIQTANYLTGNNNSLSGNYNKCIFKKYLRLVIK